MIRLLVVDDDAASTVLVQGVARLLGVETVIARDAEAALAALSAQRFPLGIFDLHMPVLDGFSLLRRLKAAGQAPARSILMTADITVEPRGLIGPDAFDAVWHKPILVATLMAELRAL